MAVALDDVSLARLPAGQLPRLAELRCRPDVAAALPGGAAGDAWVRWPAGDGSVLCVVLPVRGAVLYGRRDGRWYRPGFHLPAFEVPADLTFRTLDGLLVPARVEAEPVPTLPVTRALLGLQRAGPPAGVGGAATALTCAVAELAAWAGGVSAARLDGLAAARCGGRALVLGARLPLLPGGSRFWGRRVLCPLGFRPDPDLPGDEICAALGLDAGELLLLTGAGAEVVPREALGPLTRAGVRLAAGGGGP